MFGIQCFVIMSSCLVGCCARREVKDVDDGANTSVMQIVAYTRTYAHTHTHTEPASRPSVLTRIHCATVMSTYLSVLITIIIS